MLMIKLISEGVTPMLCHRATEEALEGSGDGKRSNVLQQRDDPRVTCEKAIYRLPGSKQIAIPGSAIARMVREAGGAHKVKGSRKSVKYLVPAAMIVMDDLVPLFLKDRRTPITDYEVDSRPVTIPATKGRVMRHRARLNEWVAICTIRLNEDIIAEATLRQLFNEGLQQIGLGDYRPEKGGPFGTSGLVAWEVISDAKPLNVAQRRNSAA
jgi:hypothetical protein